MGRPGAGSRSSSSRSSGSSHRSSSRSSGSSHRVGSSSRSSFRSRPMGSGRSSSSWSSTSRSSSYYGSSSSYGRGYSNYGYGIWGSIKRKVVNMTISFIIIFIVIAVLGTRVSKPETYQSDHNRFKLDTGYAYMNNCVNDELDWVNGADVSRGLMQFYEDTGAQPAIWLRAYDGNDLTEDEQYDIATGYYDTTFNDRQDVVLFVYFEESDPNTVGNMFLIHGTKSATIMDSEAEDIFWNYMDDAWYSFSEDETDEMFIYVFAQTGKSIMYHPTNGYDVMKIVFIGLFIVAVFGMVVILVLRSHNRAKEKAVETERILKSNLGDLADDKADDLLDKYQ